LVEYDYQLHTQHRDTELSTEMPEPISITWNSGRRGLVSKCTGIPRLPRSSTGRIPHLRDGLPTGQRMPATTRWIVMSQPVMATESPCILKGNRVILRQ